MPIARLTPTELRLSIELDSLGFADTSELVDQALPWIGQERAEMATQFGLSMDQADYNLFVLGEIGSGRTSLLTQAMQTAASTRLTPPDLCFLNNFSAPERPLALRLPAGQGAQLREYMLQLSKTLQVEIPPRLEGQEFKADSERIEKTYKTAESKNYAELEAISEARSFALRRDAGRLVFTLLGDKGHSLSEEDILTLPKQRRTEIEQAEQELRAGITHYFEKTRPLEKLMNEAIAALRRQVVKPLLEQEMQKIRNGLKKQIKDAAKLHAYLESVQLDALENVELFKPSDANEELRQEALSAIFARYRVNLIVDNEHLQGAPAIVEDNPLFRSLFGSIEYQSENDVLVTDFSRIRAGSLLKAHGGFLMLHLRDLITDPLVWEKLRRFLRSGSLQIEETGTASAPSTAISLKPEALDVDVKIILIGTRDEYYELQEADPEFARRFRVKVDFAESFLSDAETRLTSAIFVAHTCRDLGLPHFSTPAVARLLEEGHREVDDQSRQSAVFSRTKALVMESAALCQTRGAHVTEVQDVEAALRAHTLRNDYPAQRMQEAISEGDLLISVHGEKVGQINGLSVIDLGDYRFGFPGRLTAHTFAGEDGILNIEREVEMSGPIHDKGVFILQNYLASLFAHDAPLALNASIVFEQEYNGIEGDSASCAELYVLLSALSALPLKQGIAVTGALNQHGEVMPIGGLNEKIEGFFKVCESAGLDGTQGVLIPHRNRRHLMLDKQVIDAVAQGLFHIYTVEHVSEGIELLTGVASGSIDEIGAYPSDTVLREAQKTLQTYRRACLDSEHQKNTPRHLR